MRSVVSGRAALLVLPAAFLATAAFLTGHQAPFYLPLNQDQGYPYLFNAMALLQLHQPGHIDHPGTTLQAFASFFVFLKHLLSYPGQDLVDSVCLHAESYIRFINAGLALAGACALFLYGDNALRARGDAAFALVKQLACFAYFEIFCFTRIVPEPMLTIGMLALFILLDRPRPSPLWVGICLGFCLVTKISFLPLLLLVLLFDGARERALAFGAALLAFVALTIPILPQYPRFFGWVAALLTHKQAYGTGEVGLPGAGALWENFVYLLRDGPFFHVYLIFLVACAVISRRPGFPRRQGERKTLLLCLAISLLQLAVTVKHPATRYLLPSFLLSAWYLPNLLYGREGETGHRKFLLGFLLLGVLLAAYKAREWVQDQAKSLAELRQVEAKLAADPCQVIALPWAPLPTNGLSMGNSNTRQMFIYRKNLQRLYPEALSLDPVSGAFHHFEDTVPEERVRGILGRRCVYVVGPRLEKQRPPIDTAKFAVRPELVTENFGIYRLLGINK